jgi:hypothetical protein
VEFNLKSRFPGVAARKRYKQLKSACPLCILSLALALALALASQYPLRIWGLTRVTLDVKMSIQIYGCLVFFQDVWGEWQSLNAAMLAFISNLIAFGILRSNAN